MDLDDALEALENDRNVGFKDLIKICETFFKGPRIEGNHHVFKTPWAGQPWVNIQKDGKMAKRYQVKQVREALTKLKDLQGEKG